MKITFITTLAALLTGILSLVSLLFYTHKKRPRGHIMTFRELLDDNDIDLDFMDKE